MLESWRPEDGREILWVAEACEGGERGRLVHGGSTREQGRARPGLSGSSSLLNCWR
jgi:hypothetical protein